MRQPSALAQRLMEVPKFQMRFGSAQGCTVRGACRALSAGPVSGSGSHCRGGASKPAAWRRTNAPDLSTQCADNERVLRSTCTRRSRQGGRLLTSAPSRAATRAVDGSRLPPRQKFSRLPCSAARNGGAMRGWESWTPRLGGLLASCSGRTARGGANSPVARAVCRLPAATAPGLPPSSRGCVC